MGRYVDAYDVATLIRVIALDCGEKDYSGVGIDELLYLAETVIDDSPALPTADVKPVVHANWVGVSPQVDTIVCSNCGWNELASELATRYCPDCGATMDNHKEMSEVGLPSLENLKGGGHNG